MRECGTLRHVNEILRHAAAFFAVAGLNHQPR
jgi:hypothetical protein